MSLVPEQDTIVIQEFETVNSLTYVDLLGVLVGLERLPGERSDQFYERILSAARLERSSTYVGLLNEINLRLGLKLFHCLEISGDKVFEFTVTDSRARVVTDDGQWESQLFVVEPDGYVSWRTLDDIAQELSESGLSVKVLTPGPALWLARQSNVFRQVNEPITGIRHRLAKAYPIPSSLVLTGTPETYTFLNQLVIEFPSPVRENATASYLYRVCPYRAVGSKVRLMSPLDPSFTDYALTRDRKLTYQARELVSELARIDQSFWGL